MMTMMVLFDDDRDGGDDGTSTFWYETAIKEVLENSILFKKCMVTKLRPNFVFSFVSCETEGCWLSEG